MKHVVHIKTLVPNCHASLVLLTQVYRQMEAKDWERSRRSFLTHELKSNGKLMCHYCRKDDLQIKTNYKKYKATVDHVIAVAKGGDLLNHNNFVVCCDACNRKKADTPLEEFLTSKYLENKIKSNTS